jgi:hypothetical protein
MNGASGWEIIAADCMLSEGKFDKWIYYKYFAGCSYLKTREHLKSVYYILHENAEC